jgi:hypothetical protein
MKGGKFMNNCYCQTYYTRCYNRPCYVIPTSQIPYIPSCPQVIPSNGTITIGTTLTGNPGTSASVTNSGTSSNAILDFVIPRGLPGPTGPQGPVGPQGPTGTSATISIGTTTTGDPGTSASVTNVGTDTAAILNFVIPRGADATITPGVAVPTIDTTSDLPTTIATLNALITSLTNAGFLA